MIAFSGDALSSEMNDDFGSALAILARGDLTLWLAGPAASASKPMPDGRKPEPNGWSLRAVGRGPLPG